MSKSIFSWVSVADPHFQLQERYGSFDLTTGLHTRLQDKISVLSRAIDFAIEVKAGVFMILGDVFNKVNPSEVVKSLVLRELVRFLEYGEVVVLIGNHDRKSAFDFNFMPDRVLIESLTKSSAFHVISSPVIWKLSNLSVHLLPWMSDEETIEFLRSNKSYRSIGFGHLSPSGSVTSIGNFGDGVHIVENGITQDLFTTYLRFESGDIHKRQDVGNVALIGSMAHQDFSKADISQSPSLSWGQVLLDNFGNLSVEQVYHPLPDRLFNLIVIREGDTIHSLLKVGDIIEGSIVRVRLEGSESWCSKLDMKSLLEDIRSHHPFWFQIDTVRTDESVDNTPLLIDVSDFRSGIDHITGDVNLRNLGIDLIQRAQEA